MYCCFRNSDTCILIGAKCYNVAMADDDNRPPKRDKQLNIRVDTPTYEKALARAGGSTKRLRAIMRALFKLWAEEEYPDPPDELMEHDHRRAPGGGRKRKAKPPATDDDSDGD